MWDDGTIGFYDSDPGGYAESTLGTDMSDARGRFSSRLPRGGRVLDLGCGSGRDSIAFLREGFRVTAVDGSAGMCAVASGNTGLEVRNIRFSELDYEDEFDGVWACASLLHVPSSELPGVLASVNRALRRGGTLFVCFKEGGFEGVRDGRFYTDMTFDRLSAILEGSGFSVLEMWRSPDPRGNAWVNAVASAGA